MLSAALGLFVLLPVLFSCNAPWSTETMLPPPQAAQAPAAEETVAWEDPPPCQNNPQNLAAWRADLGGPARSQATAQRFQAHLNQLRPYSPLFHDLTLDELAELLALPDAAPLAELRQRALAVLWLNVISGRLNRATEVNPAGDGPPLTVAAVIEGLALETTHIGGFERYLPLAEAVNAGRQLGQQVCARLIYRHGDAIRETHWTEDGFHDHDQNVVTVPQGLTTFSPDYSRLTIETPRSDTGGGPLYLFDLQSEQLLNLNHHVGLPDYTGIASLAVNAWHYDNRHLLLVNEEDSLLIWLDLHSGAFTPLALDMDLTEMAPPREITFSPNGDGFTFLTYNQDRSATRLYWYDLNAAQTTLVRTMPISRGRLTGFNFAPDGRQAAYVVRQGRRDTEFHQELHLFDLSAATEHHLLTGHLGPTEPVWSPDGQYLAFTRKHHDRPDHAGPHAETSLGDIWLISAAGGPPQQLTFIEAIKRPPVWSPDGRYLAFVTADGQLGMAAADQPGRAWQVETEVMDPRFTALAFVP